MTTLDTATLAALRERFHVTEVPKVCPLCGWPTIKARIGPEVSRAYCIRECGWMITVNDGADPNVIALLDAYEALAAKLAAVDLWETKQTGRALRRTFGNLPPNTELYVGQNAARIFDVDTGKSLMRLQLTERLADAILESRLFDALSLAWNMIGQMMRDTDLLIALAELAGNLEVSEDDRDAALVAEVTSNGKGQQA